MSYPEINICPTEEIRRWEIVINGHVQGVGFRPFVYRTAVEAGIKGKIRNTSGGVIIEAEGEIGTLEKFLNDLSHSKPALATLSEISVSEIELLHDNSFIIEKSTVSKGNDTLILPDIAICPDCAKEIFNPKARRYLYPFTNCTNCGPRYSIITRMPYDRCRTTMSSFIMCAKCRGEYEDSHNRRFHAEPIACPDCGPQVELRDNQGKVIALKHEAILKTAETIQQGKIVALKGLGGFQLLVDADNDKAVTHLRQRKNRPHKPFALMMDSLGMVSEYCETSPIAEATLKSYQAPIVLLKQKPGKSSTSTAVNPGNPYLGVMLPYTPLHLILMREVKRPIIATSGNLAGEPICIDNDEALAKLSGIADYFLLNDRPIARPVDDSVVKIAAGKVMALRLARGYAPAVVETKSQIEPVLAIGAQQKNTIAVTSNKNIIVSQHLGDLDNLESIKTYEKTIQEVTALHGSEEHLTVCDIHPDYASTQYAERISKNSLKIQHHHAHIFSCVAENQLKPPLLGVAFDGTGYGLDSNIWGGEFFLYRDGKLIRYASLKNFRLPGGEIAVKEPRRSALGVLYEIFGPGLKEKSGLPVLEAFTEIEINGMLKMLERGFNSPLTSSAGRLFDAVSALLGLRYYTTFEGQAAMNMEYAAIDRDSDEYYEFDFISEGDRIIIDWRPCIEGLLKEIEKIKIPEISVKFHNTMARIILKTAALADIKTVALSGGCFQNSRLLEKTVDLLSKNGFKPYFQQKIPTNDGGISLGQAAAIMYFGGSHCSPQVSNEWSLTGSL